MLRTTGLRRGVQRWLGCVPNVNNEIPVLTEAIQHQHNAEWIHHAAAATENTPPQQTQTPIIKSHGADSAGSKIIRGNGIAAHKQKRNGTARLEKIRERGRQHMRCVESPLTHDYFAGWSVRSAFSKHFLRSLWLKGFGSVIRKPLSAYFATSQGDVFAVIATTGGRLSFSALCLSCASTSTPCDGKHQQRALQQVLSQQ